MLKQTPFHPRTAPLCLGQNWRRWSGHLTASSYDLVHEREYHAIRNAAALLDVSPLYKYLVSGRDAARLLDRVVTRDVIAMRPGQVGYTTWCDSAGKVIDDGTVARLGDETFRMTAADPSFRWLHENAVGMSVTIEDVSDSTAALALQGPNSRAILERLTDSDLSALRYFRAARAKVGGIGIGITRTGYTGDLGYEVWLDAKDALPIWDAVIAAGTPYGVVPAGMLALDLARIEAGLMLADVDYVSAHKALIASQTSSPFELNLGWTVKLEKEFFVGRDALVAEHKRGAAWKFIGINVEWEPLEQLYADVGLPPRLPMVAWRTSVPLYQGPDQVGYATSGCWSPLLKRYIALAHVPVAYGAPGTRLDMEVTVEHKRKRTPARVVPLPFFDPARKKA
jgi:aminomethyltransferase